MFQISRGNECPRKIETNALFDRVGKPIHRHRPLKGFFVQVYAKTGCVWHGNQPGLDGITSGIQSGRGRFIPFDVGEVTQRASQMTECLGAGTGCGWCIPFLKKIAASPETFLAEGLSPEEYAAKRQEYIKTRQPRNEF